MVKTYLKFELRDTHGIITSSNAVLDQQGGLSAVTGTLDSVSSWDLTRSERTWQARDAEDTKSEVVVVAQARPDTSSSSAVVATGHSDGTVRLWPRPPTREGKCIRRTYNDTQSSLTPIDDTDGAEDDETEKGEVVTLAGHRSGISALVFSSSGMLLASGSRDTDIVVWDVARERGLYRLRGHTAPVTALAWIEQTRPSPRMLLVSASRDGLVKVWDAARQQCIQTVVGHRAEVLSLAVSPDTNTVYTGAADGKLRVWDIVVDGVKTEDMDSGEAAAEFGDAEQVLRLAGELIPPFGTRGDGLAGARRVSGVSVSADGRVLMCVVGDRIVAVYHIATNEEVTKKRRRRQRRANAKKQRKQGKSGAVESSDKVEDGDEEEGEEDGDAGDVENPNEAVEERHQYLWPLRSAQGKIRSAVVSGDGKMALLALANNTLELYSLKLDANKSASDGDDAGNHYDLVRAIEAQGHRTDVRAAVLTADDQTLVTVSNGCTKVWAVRSGRCLRTIECSYGLCACILPGGRHAVVGTKEGTLQLVDIAAGVIVEEVEAHSGAVWSVCTRPGGRGVVSGGADKQVKFWSFGARATGNSGRGRVLTLVEGRATPMDDDVLCVRLSADGSLLAVAQLDSIIKVFKVVGESEGDDDSMDEPGAAGELKFFLSLYGHKLPVLALDISDDGRLLVSGSADKNVKIWGLDFGDCHRSLFAHDDSVTQVAFQPRTHYFFSVGKDGALKYWDADKFEQVQSLPGQRGVGSPCWTVAVGGAGQLLVTAGHDRSLRVWERTQEQLFLDEEKERALDEQFEAAIEEQEDFAARNDPTRPEAMAADRKTLATVRSGEALLEALDIAEEESAKFALYNGEIAEIRRKQAAEDGDDAMDDVDKKLRAAAGLAVKDKDSHRASGESELKQNLPPEPEKNPLMLGLSPADYVLSALARIPAGHLEQSLLLLPFHHVIAFLKYADDLVSRGQRVELVAKCVFFLFSTHHSQLTATSDANVRPLVLSLRQNITAALSAQRDRVGFNLAALSFMKRELDAEAEAKLYSADNIELQMSQIRIAQKIKQSKSSKGKKGSKNPAASIPQI